MPFVNELNISGSLTPEGLNDTGTLSLLASTLTGSTILPKSIDTTMIHYDTKANWDRQTFLITEKGHLYIYKDAKYSYVNGKKVYYAGIKIGDGTSYLIDMPYVLIANDRQILDDHIHNTAIHVANLDRINWNDKVSVSIKQDNEELIFKK